MRCRTTHLLCDMCLRSPTDYGALSLGVGAIPHRAGLLTGIRKPTSVTQFNGPDEFFKERTNGIY